MCNVCVEQGFVFLLYVICMFGVLLGGAVTSNYKDIICRLCRCHYVAMSLCRYVSPTPPRNREEDIIRLCRPSVMMYFGGKLNYCFVVAERLIPYISR